MGQTLFISEDYLPPIEVPTPNPGQPTLVVGSPRSGKTSSLRHLVSKLEQTVAPDSILVLTPTRLAAAKLRDLIALDSNRSATKPRARSISSFAFDVLNSKQVRLLSGAAQERLLSQLVQDAAALKAGARWGVDNQTLKLAGFVQELRDLLSVIIENSLSQEQLISLQKQFPTLKLQVAIDLLPKYREQLGLQGLLDPSQLVVAAISDYQPGSYSHVVVDDAQNLSPGQLRLVEKVLESATGYFFGDPDSATLGFRASAAGSFIELARKHSFVELTLQPAQTDATAGLLSRLAQRIPVSLFAEHRPSTIEHQVQGFVFGSLVEETDWLAAELRKASLAGLSWSDMIVIGRTRSQLEQLSRELAARKVPIRIQGVQRALAEHPMSLALLDFLVAALGDASLEQLEQLLLSPLVGLDSISLREIRRLMIPARQQGLTAKEALLELLLENPPRMLQPLSEKILELRSVSSPSCHQAVSIAWQLISEKRVSQLSDSDLDAALELFAAAIRFDDRQEGSALEFAQLQLKASIPEDSLAPISRIPAVTLATPAQITGDYKLVAMPRLQEGIWPNLNPRNSLLGAASLQAYLVGRLSNPTAATKSELADELRMFYKSIGSASERVLLSAMSDESEQPSQFFQLAKVELQEAKAFDFDLRKMVGRLRRALLNGDQTAAAQLAALAIAGVPGAHPSSWQGLMPISSEEPLSVATNSVAASRVEAFEKCPLHWFISSFGTDSVGFQAALGTLLHAALENSDVAKPVEFVSSHWQEIEFDSNLTERQVKKEALAMAGLIEQYLSEGSELLAAEQGFAIEIGNLKVVGKIDRIESTPDGPLAVDLKTGKKIPTKKEAAANRQLSIYQLAIEQMQQTPSVGGKLVSVGDGKLKQLEQPPLSEQDRLELAQLAEQILQQLGQSQLVSSSEHCSKDANCQLLLNRVVTNG